MSENVLEPISKEVDGKKRYFCAVEGCINERATQQGYVTRKSYYRHFADFHVKSETIGLISRLDWGSPGFRQGLVDAAFDVFRKEKVHFIVVAGGLVAFPHMKKEFSKPGLRRVALNNGFFYSEKTKDGKTINKPNLEKAREFLLNQAANGLAKSLPKIKSGTGYVKIYIVTSPAPNYDCWVGAEVARRLVRLRPDIRFWDERSARFPLKNQNKLVWVLTPLKASWRSKYHSTAVDRLIEDEERQTSHNLPDLWVVGCTASSLQRPAGEKKRPHISVPALHKLQETHTAENQVGALVVEFVPDSEEFLVRDYTLKGQTARESEWIPEPKNATDLQSTIVKAIKNRDGLTIGMLEDALKTPRGQIKQAIKALNDGGYAPKISEDEDSGIYRFDPDWIRHKLVYPKISLEGLTETSLLGFGCLHAGSIFQEYDFFTKKVPEIALKHNVSVLVGAGDFVEGTQHFLMEKGEVLGGFNNTDQEILAAREVATVITKIFTSRFSKITAEHKVKLGGKKLKKAVEDSLINFIYTVGNHDAWIGNEGVTPLQTFHMTLVQLLQSKLATVLNSFGLACQYLPELVDARVTRGEVSPTPSGLDLTVIHPFMARAMTSSLRAQHTLDMATTKLVVIANFHVAVKVGQWDADFGQRVALQVGALVWKTSFEHSKLKTLDVGVGYLRVLSNKEGRILMSETAFFGGGERKVYDNSILRESFLEKLEI